MYNLVMKKLLKVILGLFGIALLTLICFGIYKFDFTNQDIFLDNGKQINTYDATYTVNGQKVTLINGMAETEAAPGSSSKVVTKFFGNEVEQDLNADGIPDIVFLITQTSGGIGIFYYVVGLIKTANGNVGSDAVFLGDRIAPQTTEIGKNNIIVVNYAERKAGESFAVQPSIGKSIWLLLDTKTMKFGEVAQNFEGEADVSKMNLGMTTWKWISTTYTGDPTITPKLANKFTLTFKDGGKFTATTDCNVVSGEYSFNENVITLSKMITTLMYCDGSQEGQYTTMLDRISNFHFTSKGELIFGFRNNGGEMIFR